VTIDRHPGRSAQTIGVAHALGTDPDLIHEPSVGVVGTKGDSQCYLGVMSKVEAIHAQLKARIGTGPDQLKMRLVQPEYTIATSDGIRNGTREMRYSLIGREGDAGRTLRASERHRPRWHDRGRCLRQAAGRHALGAARA
jgi:dihydroxy-acid dehydratase